MSEQAAPDRFERTPATDEVLRRVGRNVVVFQQLENLLKVLAHLVRLDTPVSEVSARMERQAASVQRLTMGQLVRRLAGSELQPGGDDGPTEDIDEIWISFRLFIEMDDEEMERHDRVLRALVEQRNELVHGFLPRKQAAVDGDSDAVLADLDSQHERAMVALERLRGWVLTLKEHAEFLASPEGRRGIAVALLRSSRLVEMLGQIAMTTCRPDGWTLLSTAGQLIKREAPQELDDLRKRFGTPTLKAALVASGLFDVVDEATPGGGTRTIYRGAVLCSDLVDRSA